MLHHRFGTVVVDLSGCPVEERRRFYTEISPTIWSHRAATCLPHWILVDEAQYFFLGDKALERGRRPRQSWRSAPRDLRARPPAGVSPGRNRCRDPSSGCRANVEAAHREQRASPRARLAPVASTRSRDPLGSRRGPHRFAGSPTNRSSPPLAQVSGRPAPALEAILLPPATWGRQRRNGREHHRIPSGARSLRPGCPLAACRPGRLLAVVGGCVQRQLAESGVRNYRGAASSRHRLADRSSTIRVSRGDRASLSRPLICLVTACCRHGRAGPSVPAARPTSSEPWAVRSSRLGEACIAGASIGGSTDALPGEP